MTTDTATSAINGKLADISDHQANLARLSEIDGATAERTRERIRKRIDELTAEVNDLTLRFLGVEAQAAASRDGLIAAGESLVVDLAEGAKPLRCADCNKAARGFYFIGKVRLCQSCYQLACSKEVF